MNDLSSLFLDHLKTRQASAEEALGRTGFDSLVISSGEAYTYFADDNDAPFHAVPHFSHWCPLSGPHHLLKIQSGKKPSLIRYAPEDFWYEQAPLDSSFWTDAFEITNAPSLDAAWASLGNPKKAAYIGNETARAKIAGLEPNPEKLTAHLDWSRSFKTPYEIACVEEAQRLGALGHKAAKAAFDAGASELEIHYAFVQALGCVDDELPYTTIVGLNEKGATLHYHGKRKDVRKGDVLLIDAGAKSNGYASDITRTHAAPSCDSRFVALLKGMEGLQRELCDEVKPNLQYAELHLSAHRKIAALLWESGILRCSPEEAFDKQYTKPFFPHGLGHHLGLQVHDVAGKQLTPAGDYAAQPPQHPFLRTNRMIEEGQVFTVEPGLYFIPMLLRAYRENGAAKAFDWKLIDELTPCGGIRIEDNVLVTSAGHRNLTREQLPN
jgi:Xaa-Pro dipeptidase